MNQNLGKSRERNDCSVRAIAAVTNNDYELAHNTLRMFGRKKNKRTTRDAMFLSIKLLGFSCREVNFEGKTVRTVQRELTNGKYLVFVRAHVLAVVDGEAIDWASGRLHRVLNVYRIEKENE